MKTSSTVLAVLVLLVLIACTQAVAQTAPTAQAPAPAASPATAAFLASLSVDPATAPGNLAPAPVFKTGCTSNDQCPTGQICCYPCGIEGCENVCMTPWRGGECPAFP
jgi:hypothetical protein